ncbi:unnamed protein product [Brassicogethes aeneus]|uniref:p53 DNA-binding domain-containing protein n=1 Tax=Brassicogethes aeneus TaxID=1431903 RepID=A0A9P0B423_BRAAE|nr:unnamed protein product [Brassicogethes aeneus]
MNDHLPNVALLENLVFNDSQGEGNLYNFEDGEHFQDLDEIDTKMIIPIPIASNVISNEEYPGCYEFEVCIIPVQNKQPWVFSIALNKVFMDMSNPFPIDFKIKDSYMRTEQLYVRATPRYSQTQSLHDLVHRCINHEHIHEPTNKDVGDPLHRQHIIRCKNPNTTYLGDKNKNERLSVIIPLSTPEAGTDSVKEMYEFVCKNSCPVPGMNRRPIQIIFTLENVQGIIYGRRVLNVRICSCPKRDKEKEEAELQNANNPVPHGKKRKLNNKTDKKPLQPPDQTKDNKEYELNLKIVGKHNVQQVLKYCQDLMAGEIIRNTPQGAEPFKKCLNDLQQIGK